MPLPPRYYGSWRIGFSTGRNLGLWFTKANDYFMVHRLNLWTIQFHYVPLKYWKGMK